VVWCGGGGGGGKGTDHAHQLWGTHIILKKIVEESFFEKVEHVYQRKHDP